MIVRGAQLASTGQERRGDGREKGDLISFRDRRGQWWTDTDELSQMLFWKERTITIQLHFIHCLGTEREAQVSNRCKQNKSDQRSKWMHPRPEVPVYTSTQQGGMPQNRFSNECWREENETCKVCVGWVLHVVFFCFLFFFICSRFWREKEEEQGECSHIPGHAIYCRQCGQEGNACWHSYHAAPVATYKNTSARPDTMLCKHEILTLSYRGGTRKEGGVVSHFNTFYNASRCHLLVSLWAYHYHKICMLCGLKIPLQCKNNNN